MRPQVISETYGITMYKGPMRPTAGGIFFERNLRTKYISSNEEKF